MRSFFFLACILVAACSHLTIKKLSTEEHRIAFYIYPNKLVHAALQSDDAIRNQFSEIFSHLGRKGPRGDVGIAIVFPYLSWTEGTGKGPYIN